MPRDLWNPLVPAAIAACAPLVAWLLLKAIGKYTPGATGAEPPHGRE